MKTLRLLLLFVVLIFLLPSCDLQNDENVEPNHSQVTNLKKLQITSIKNEKQLSVALSKLGYLSLNNGRVATSANLSVENIIKVLQPDSTSYAFSVAIKSDDLNKILKNLVLKEVKGGYLGFMLEYTADEQLPYKSDGKFDIKAFTGTLKRFDLEGKLLFTIRYENGVQVNQQKANARMASICVVSSYIASEVIGEECDDSFSPILLEGDNSNLTKTQYGGCETQTQSYIVYVYGDCGGSGGSFVGDGSGSTGDSGGVTTPGGSDSGEDELKFVEYVGVTEPVEPILILKDQTIIDNPLADCIYDKLIPGSSAYNKFLVEFKNSTKYNVTFKLKANLTDSQGNPANGTTEYTIGNTNVTIFINSSTLNRPSWEIAGTFIHEMAHAYLAQKLISIGGPGNLGQYTTNTNFEDLFDYYTKYVKIIDNKHTYTSIENSIAQHNLMADKLITDIAEGIREYIEANTPEIKQEPVITLEHYKAVAWNGLRETNAYTSLSLDEQSNIRKNTTVLQSFTINGCQ